MAEAKSLRLLRGEDEGHFGCSFAVYTPHCNIGTTARMHPSLVLRHRFGGSAIGAAKVLLPRDPCRTVFLLVREPCPASHIVSLPRPDAQMLPEQSVSGWGVMQL